MVQIQLAPNTVKGNGTALACNCLDVRCVRHSSGHGPFSQSVAKRVDFMAQHIALV